MGPLLEIKARLLYLRSLISEINYESMFNEEFIIYQRGQTNTSQFLAKGQRAAGLILDEYDYFKYKHLELLKGFCTSERVVLDGKNVNLEWQGGIPADLCTNDDCLVNEFRTNPALNEDCVIVCLDDMCVGPPGTDPIDFGLRVSCRDHIISDGDREKLDFHLRQREKKKYQDTSEKASFLSVCSTDVSVTASPTRRSKRERKKTDERELGDILLKKVN